MTSLFTVFVFFVVVLVMCYLFDRAKMKKDRRKGD